MTEALPDYDDLAVALEEVRSVTGPAECHGIAVGQLCAAPRFEPAVWLRHIFDGDPSASSATLDCARLLAALAKDADRRLKSSDVELKLFLPDTGPLDERVAALAAWCRGFLLGISLAGLHDFESCSSETREFVVDLGAVGRADADSLTQSEDDDERAYAEIVEYVRVGALLLREDALFNRSVEPED
jgi:hypothetical protein